MLFNFGRSAFGQNGPRATDARCFGSRSYPVEPDGSAADVSAARPRDAKISPRGESRSERQDSASKARGRSRREAPLRSPRTNDIAGDQTAGVTPVPIPNTEVKPRRADGTARESVWERRSSPA